MGDMKCCVFLTVVLLSIYDPASARKAVCPTNEVFVVKPAASMEADVVRFSCHLNTRQLSTVPTWKNWEVMLKRDGRKVTSNVSIVSPENVVSEVFTLNKTLDVYGRYECALTQDQRNCRKGPSSVEHRLQPVAYVDLYPYQVFTELKATFNHTCWLFVDDSKDIYAIIITFNGTEIHRLSVRPQNTSKDIPDMFDVVVEMQIKDPSRFGIYECRQEKNGLQHPKTEDLNGRLKGRKELMNNTFQVVPSFVTLRNLSSQRLVSSLGETVFVPCFHYKCACATDILPDLMWYRNDSQITDRNSCATFINQRFRISENMVSVFWMIVTIQTAEDFGVFECRFVNDKRSDTCGSVPTSFLIEPENWREQALTLMEVVKAQIDNRETMEKTCDDRIRQRDDTSVQLFRQLTHVMDDREEWRSLASLLLEVLSAIFLASGLIAIVWLCRLAKRKIMERDLRTTLNNIQQMDVFSEGSIEGSYRYDVFISYSSADANWVREDLLRKLERNGYTVCLDTRDFPAGKPILTNIATAIYQSRKVIVVMSKNFINSGWCMHELVLTYQRKLDQKENCVVVVKYEDCKIPDEMALRTYLDWTEPMARETFWAKLHEWLGPPGSPLDLNIEEQDKKVKLHEVKDPETSHQDGGNPADPQERDDVVLRQRQNIPSNGSD